jgi:E3 ubiquitin-protein ligase DOA10
MNVGMSKAALNLKTIVCDESEDENVEIFEPVTNIRDYSDGENVENLDNLECMKHNNNLDELMNDIAMNFLDIPEIFENLYNNSNMPLYLDCTKFTKISAIFKLYNLKAKKWI